MSLPALFDLDFREEASNDQELRNRSEISDSYHHRQHVQGVSRHDTLRSRLTDVHGNGRKA